VLERVEQTTRQRKGKEKWRVSSAIETSGSARILVPARVSTQPANDLIVVDPVSHQLQILINDKGIVAESANYRVAASLDTEDIPVAVLPMRLNEDALSDLVILKKGGQSSVSVVRTA